MCGRYSLDVNLELLSSRYGVEVETISYFQQPEVFPTTLNPVFDMNHSFEMMKWGFSNTFNQNSIINARLETIDEKPMFKHSIKEYRCLIPATSFFEWEKPSKIKREIFVQKQKIFSMAGIYRIVEGNHQYSILTMAANDEMKQLHHRMPVILEASQELAYLDDNASLNQIIQLCKGSNPHFMIQ